MLDLTTVRDHPANVLRRLAAVSPGSEQYREGIALAADALRLHEASHGVTFAALDNDALAALREAYRDSENAQYTDLAPQALENLQSAVRALLGLDDK